MMSEYWHWPLEVVFALQSPKYLWSDYVETVWIQIESDHLPEVVSKVQISWTWEQNVVFIHVRTSYSTHLRCGSRSTCAQWKQQQQRLFIALSHHKLEVSEEKCPWGKKRLALSFCWWLYSDVTVVFPQPPFHPKMCQPPLVRKCKIGTIFFHQLWLLGVTATTAERNAATFLLFSPFFFLSHCCLASTSRLRPQLAIIRKSYNDHNSVLPVPSTLNCQRSDLIIYCTTCF